jgi:hypothetical protein
VPHERGLPVIPVKVPFENEVVDADQVMFESTPGVPQSLKIEDGATIEFGHVVHTVFKLRDRKKEDGTPIYICVGNTVIRIKHDEEETVTKTAD